MLCLDTFTVAYTREHQVATQCTAFCQQYTACRHVWLLPVIWDARSCSLLLAVFIGEPLSDSGVFPRRYFAIKGPFY